MPLTTRQAQLDRPACVAASKVKKSWIGARSSATAGAASTMMPQPANSELGGQAQYPPNSFAESRTAMTIADGRGRIIAANAAAQELLGVPSGDLLGADLLALTEPPPADGETARAVGDLARLVGDGWPRTREQLLVTTDGARRWVRQILVAQLDHDGGIAQVLVRWDDISAARQTGERLRRAASAFEQAPVGMALIDPQARIIDVNQAFSSITGHARDGAIGRDVRLLGDGQHGPGVLADAWVQLRTHDAWEGEQWTRRANGKSVALRISIRATKPADGGIDGYIASLLDITAEKRQCERLQREAHHDALTGLPNRILLEQRLAYALHGTRRRDHCLALAYIDLDDFKAINDTHGHEVGDQYLMVVAHRLLGALRDTDTVARVGGDEFVVLVSDPETVAKCESVIIRLQQVLAGRIELGGLDLPVAASIGVAVNAPGERADSTGLLRRADQAMYLAKQAGKGQYRICRGSGTAAVHSS